MTLDIALTLGIIVAAVVLLQAQSQERGKRRPNRSSLLPFLSVAASYR